MLRVKKPSCNLDASIVVLYNRASNLVPTGPAMASLKLDASTFALPVSMMTSNPFGLIAPLGGAWRFPAASRMLIVAMSAHTQVTCISTHKNKSIEYK